VILLSLGMLRTGQIIGGSLVFPSSLYILAARNRGWDPTPGEAVAGISVVLLFAYIWKSSQES